MKLDLGSHKSDAKRPMLIVLIHKVKLKKMGVSSLMAIDLPSQWEGKLPRNHLCPNTEAKPFPQALENSFHLMSTVQSIGGRIGVLLNLSKKYYPEVETNT